MVGPSVRRLLMGGTAVLLVAGILAFAVSADPRNESDEYFDAVDGGACLEHHLEDGLIPFSFRFREAYSQLPIEEPVTIRVEIIHSTQYTAHRVEDMSVTVDRSQAMNVVVVTDDMPEPIAKTLGPEELRHGEAISTGDVFIGPGAHEGHFSAQARMSGLPAGERDLVPGELWLEADDVRTTGTGHYVAMPLDGSFFTERGPRNYTFAAGWAMNPLLPDSVTVEVTARLFVNFTQEATEFTFHTQDPVLASKGERTHVDIPVMITSEDQALLDFQIRANIHHPHRPIDKAPRDDGLYYRFLTMQVTGGDEPRIVLQQEAPTPVGEVVNLYNLLTRVFGFIALLLVFTAMLTGGVFGKASRRMMNRATGGAKKRVLWHSAAGFLIIVVATAHFALALVETRNDISTGLLWGGLAWFILITLGFTGYYQVRIIRRWNYRVWRHVHLWSAVAVLLFALTHTVLEGTDLRPVRDALPDWVDHLDWPR